MLHPTARGILTWAGTVQDTAMYTGIFKGDRTMCKKSPQRISIGRLLEAALSTFLLGMLLFMVLFFAPVYSDLFGREPDTVQASPTAYCEKVNQ